MELSIDNNSQAKQTNASYLENNNILKYDLNTSENSTNIQCCQGEFPEPGVQAVQNCEKEFDNAYTEDDEGFVPSPTSLELNDDDHLNICENDDHLNICENEMQPPKDDNLSIAPSKSTIDNQEYEAKKESDNLEAADVFLGESQSEFIYDGRYGNVLIMEFLGKTKEVISLSPGLDDFEDLMDDLLSNWHLNDKFEGVCDPEPQVPLRCLESLPSIYKNKKRGGPKMVAFQILKPERMPELLKISKLSFSKVWEFEDKERDVMVRYTPEDEFPVTCRLPDPIVRNIDDLPIEIWGDHGSEDRKGIVKFNNTQNMKETQLLMVSDYTATNHKPHHYFLGICYECSEFPSGGIELSRCGGCQLVAYCSRDCQKKNWKKHKYICKALPVKKGKNVFTRGRSGIRKQDSWDKLIYELDDKARKAWNNGNNRSSDSCCSSEDKNSCDSSSNVNDSSSCDKIDCDDEIICNSSCNGSSSCDSIVDGSSKNRCRHDSSILDDSNCYPEELIYWGRYCSICYETRMEKLFDCTCGCVSYCSNEHRNMDMEHFDFCHTLYLSTRVYKFFKQFPGNVYLPYYKQVQKVYQPLTTMLDFLTMCRARIKQEEWLDVKFALMSERLSYPLTIIYALQNMGVGPEKKSIGEIEELNLHILSHHAMLDASIWEMVLHYLPSLKTLNVSYIGEQYVARRMANDLNVSCTKLKRCEDCEEKDRIISIAVYPMHYHMFFSSDHYSDPDAIGVFQLAGIIDTTDEDEDVHATTSFRNLTYDKHVPLIITDIEIDQLARSTKKIHEARPIEVKIPAKNNPFSGYRSNRRHKCGYGNHIINDAEYFACLLQK